MASPLFLCILLVIFGSYVSISAAGDVTPRLNSATVPVVHRHGPCAKSQSTDKPSFAEALHRSRVRADYIMSWGRSWTRTRSTWSVVTLGLGTPAVEQVVLLDTGSDLSWVQCAPCNSTQCYQQKDPLFDPRKSSTYAPVPCGSDVCNSLQSDHFDNGCTNDGTECGFRVEYGDGSKTKGVYSNEALTLAPSVVINDFHFGCGYKQAGPNDKFDGLLGLGGAPESLPAYSMT
uniref:Aspartic proteinase nepenthesin-1 n=1 Tax=Aegilops tauschii TaxID=37682 RepID=M8BZF6_AEGTA